MNSSFSSQCFYSLYTLMSKVRLRISSSVAWIDYMRHKLLDLNTAINVMVFYSMCKCPEELIICINCFYDFCIMLIYFKYYSIAVRPVFISCLLLNLRLLRNFKGQSSKPIEENPFIYMQSYYNIIELHLQCLI